MCGYEGAAAGTLQLVVRTRHTSIGMRLPTTTTNNKLFILIYLST